MCVLLCAMALLIGAGQTLKIGTHIGPAAVLSPIKLRIQALDFPYNHEEVLTYQLAQLVARLVDPSSPRNKGASLIATRESLLVPAQPCHLLLLLPSLAPTADPASFLFLLLIPVVSAPACLSLPLLSCQPCL